MTPRARIKASVAGYDHADELLRDILARRVFLGAEPGSRHIETIAGHTLIAHRLRCGGVDVREPGIDGGGE